MAEGLLFILSSPSGAGKTSVCQKILAENPRIFLSVSATTRAPRPHEVDGQDYFFLSNDDFERQRLAGKFLETAYVFGHWYGTPQAAVEEQLAQHRDVLFDVDWQGARAIAQKWGGRGVVRIFILPPSLKILEQRLNGRGQDTEAVVQQRMGRALEEMSHWAEYDYVLVNYDLEETVSGVRQIIGAEHHKRAHQRNLFDWVAALANPEPEPAQDLSGKKV